MDKHLKKFTTFTILDDSDDTDADSDVCIANNVVSCSLCGVYICKEHTTPTFPTCNTAKENSENSNDDL